MEGIENFLIENFGLFCNRFPPKRPDFPVYEFETEWYKGRFDFKRESLYVKVKCGKVFRMAEDHCYFCGLHSPLGGGHLFAGREFVSGWYRNRQGWISNGDVQICPECQGTKTWLQSKRDKEEEQ